MTFMRKLLDVLNMNNWENHSDRLNKKFVDETTEITSEISKREDFENVNPPKKELSSEEFEIFIRSCNKYVEKQEYKTAEASSQTVNHYVSPKWSSIRNEAEIELERRQLNLKNVTIYFENGTIVNVMPDVYDYYKAQFYIINGIAYDTYSISSVESIPNLDFSSRKHLGTPVYYLEYLLQIRASQERRLHNNELAYALLKKSISILKASNSSYGKNIIMRLPNWMYQDGHIQEAKKLEQSLKEEMPEIFNDSFLHYSAFQKILDYCKKMNTDYIFCTSHQGACPICAKYQCRVYCISGNDKRFPKLPEIVYEYGGFHKGCRHNFYPHDIEIDTTIKDHNLNEYDALKYSNRPFIDDRTEEDIHYYQIYVEKQKLREDSAHNKEIYYDLIQVIPEVMPKSLASFTKMKRANSKRYQQIVAAAHNAGIEI